MIEPMWVPWPKVSRWTRSGSWDSNDRSGPWTTLPLVRPFTGATPLSISATSTPLPVKPLVQASFAWVIWATL